MTRCLYPAVAVEIRSVGDRLSSCIMQSTVLCRSVRRGALLLHCTASDGPIRGYARTRRFRVRGVFGLRHACASLSAVNAHDHPTTIHQDAILFLVA